MRHEEDVVADARLAGALAVAYEADGVGIAWNASSAGTGDSCTMTQHSHILHVSSHVSLGTLMPATHDSKLILCDTITKVNDTIDTTFDTAFARRDTI